MGRTAVFQGVRTLRFRDALGQCEARDLSQLEAAEVLGVSERTFRRWCRRFEDEGEAGLVERRLGKPSAKRVPLDEALQVEELNRSRYAGFTVKHFHERLCDDHVFRWGYTWSKTFLHGSDLVAPAPRRPLVGMMLHQDGSTHPWLPGGAEDDLIASLDDAPGTLYSAFLVEHPVELPGACRGVRRPRPARAASIPTAPATTSTPQRQGGRVDKGKPIQVGRALALLGIEHIAAYSPEARRRSERAFLTLPGAPTQGARPARHHHPRRGQPLPRRDLHPQLLRLLRGGARATGLGLRRRRSRAVAGRPLYPGGAHRRQRQHRALQQPRPADPAQAALRRGQGPPSKHYPDASLAVLHDPRCLAP